MVDSFSARDGAKASQQVFVGPVSLVTKSKVRSRPAVLMLMYVIASQMKGKSSFVDVLQSSYMCLPVEEGQIVLFKISLVLMCVCALVFYVITAIGRMG